MEEGHMIVGWLLIFQSLHVDTGLSIGQFGPFKTEAACKAAGQKTEERFKASNYWVCVSTGD
jgi:hypothetical protein